METLLITATDVTCPARTTWTSDLVWVGDWQPPPLEPAWWRVYLPLVVRSR